MKHYHKKLCTDNWHCIHKCHKPCRYKKGGIVKHEYLCTLLTYMALASYIAVSCCPPPSFSLGACTLEPPAFLVLTSTSAASGCSFLIHREKSMYSAAASRTREMVSTSLLKLGLFLGFSFQHSSSIAKLPTELQRS